MFYSVKIRLLVLTIFLALAPLGSVCADDVTDSINEALKQYENGEFADAVQSLDYASQLIRQKKGGQLEAFLPAPLAGWKAEEAQSSAAGAAMFGGGVTAERSYTKGDSRMQVNIITDSPMMQGMMVMFSNPMMATADGGKLEKINGEKAIVKYSKENKDGNINLVVGNRFMITIDGSDITREDLLAYAKAIDFKKLSTLP
ncbi:MAG: hypothetical protein AB7S77_08625 [Desulfatirhabdiaceae bacterium]